MTAPDTPNMSPGGLQTPVSTDGDRTTGSITQAATRDLADLGDEVKQQASAIGEEAKAQLGEMAHDMADKARGMAAEQKEMVAGHLSGVASALDRVATELETDGEPIARYARMVADGADRMTSAVADHDVDELLEMAQEFGRRQPAAFLGAAALLGFAASRFVMASAARRTTSVGSSMSTGTSATVGSAYDDTSARPPVGSGTGNRPVYGSTIGGGNGTI